MQPLVVTRIFGSAVASAGGRRTETHPHAVRPGITIEARLRFAFRYEPIPLAFLARLFDQMDAAIPLA